MTAEIGPGTLLICIKPHTLRGSIADPIYEGSMYTCEKLTSVYRGQTSTHCGFCGSEHLFVVLRGHNKGYPWCPTRFRPLNDGDTSLVKDEEIIEEPALLGGINREPSPYWKTTKEPV